MGESIRTLHCGAEADIPDSLLAQRKLHFGCPARHGGRGDAEVFWTSAEPEYSRCHETECRPPALRNSPDGGTEPDKLADELAILYESQQIAQIGSYWRSPSGPVWWSPEMYRLYGVLPESFAPTMEGLLKLIHLEDRQSFQAWFKGGLDEENPAPLEFRVIQPDGSVRWLIGRSTLKKAGADTPVFLAGTAQDITERKRMEQSLVEALDYSRLLIEVCPSGVVVFRATGDCISANEAAAKIVGATVDQLKKQNFWNLESWKKSGLLKSVEHVLATNSIVETEFHLNPSSFGKESWISARIVPFVYNSEQQVLALYSDVTEKKAIEDQNRTYVEKLETSFMQTVQAITALSEMRDSYTTGHERHVAEIAVALGAELGFDARRQQGLRVAGLLHDIGKINIPNEILSKAGKLGSLEFALVKQHAQAGYSVLKNVDFPWPVALVALQHHERMDGSGYPHGLKGDEITLEARIVAVADVVESMSSHRPYRAALGLERALAEIEHGRETMFDAEVADACLRLFREGRYQLPE